MSGDGAVIGIDVGGTSIAADLVDLEGRALFSASCSTGRGRAAIDAVLAQLNAAQDAAREAETEVLGVGLLSPGHVDKQRGIVHFASNLDWRDLDLPGEIAAAMSGSLPVALGHDVRWAGIAEGVLGAAAGLDDYALVAIGTGIAACLVSGGQVLTGADGSAGEFGHATVFHAGDRCACGRTGCVDAYASGAGLLRRYRNLGGASELADVADLLTALPSDPVARRVWNDGVEALARGLCTLTMTVDPDTIVIAGGLSGAGEALTDPLPPGAAAGLEDRTERRDLPTGRLCGTRRRRAVGADRCREETVSTHLERADHPPLGPHGGAGGGARATHRIPGRGAPATHRIWRHR